MNTTELLELAAMAAEGQKGERGPAGVGIRDINQSSPTSFTIVLEDGRTQEIQVPAPIKGEQGDRGATGGKGDPGPAGSAGKNGVAGSNGRNGLDGQPGTFVDTGVVTPDGRLLIGLSNGTSIDCGRVIGPAGATGATGATGLPGKAGKDGTSTLTAFRPPSQDDGKEGDSWIDCSSAEFSFYKKLGQGWSKIADLRQPVKDTRISTAVGGGGGGGGGGNGELQNTRTLPLINGGSTIRKRAEARDLPTVPGKMDTQEDANLYFLDAMSRAGVTLSEAVPRPPSVAGQLWFCTSPDDLTLYVYDGAVWVPAAPPVSLDGVQSAIASIDEQLLKVNANVAMNKSELDEKALDIQLDQDRQDAELQDLHEKVDGIAEEFDRGKWAHVTEKPTVGQYALGVKATKEYCQDQYAKCVEDADGDPEKLSVCTRQMGDCENKEDEGGSVYVSRWGQVDHISIHTEESDGSTHGFGDYTADKYIEIVNEGDEGNATYIITEDAKIEDGVAIVAVSDIQSTGAPSGLGRFKVFEMKSGDPTDYVRKAGDLMNGGLQIQPKKDTETGLVVFAGKNLPSESKGTVFAVTNARGHEILRVHNHGRIRAGGREIDYTPEDDSDLVTKKYVDQMGLLPGPARLAWRWLGAIDGAKEPEDGGFYKSGDYLRISFKTDNNIDLGDNLFPDTQFLSTQYGPFGTIWKYNEKDNKWQMMRQIRVDGFRWNYNNHMEYNLSSSHGRSFNDLVVGQAYYITIGGFF
jgi:hypothetical protein